VSQPSSQLVAIRTVAARLEPFDWPFAADNRAAIADYWQRASEDKPGMFNGRVLLQHRGIVSGDVFEAAYFEADYASFLAWTRSGYPGGGVRNGFALAALRAADGAFLLGEMGAGTANAGKVYFAAGTPDLNDLTADGSVDLAGSVMRELAEETGLNARDVAVGLGWRVVLSPERAAFMRPVSIDLPADAARALILERIGRQQEPELSDIVIVRSPADIDPARMPHFQQVFLRDAFATR